MEFSTFFGWLIRSSAMAVVLVCIILLLKAVFKNKLGARWHYYIWFLLLIRLFIPFSPESPISIFNLFSMVEENIVVPELIGGNDVKSPANLVKPNKTYLLPDVGSSLKESRDVTLSRIPAMNRNTAEASKPEPLYLVWLIGASALGLYFVIFNVHFRLKVRKGETIADKDLIQLLESCKSVMRIHTNLTLVKTSEVQTPALFGIIRPKLLLPVDINKKLKHEELRYVILHELAHFKRKDVTVNWLMGLLQVMHWFNPFIWFAFYRMRHDCEIACDALVLSYITPEEHKKYGRTIINILERILKPVYLPGVVGIVESKSQIKRRIAMIAKFRKNPLKGSILAVIIFIAVGCSALTSSNNTDIEKQLVNDINYYFEINDINKLFDAYNNKLDGAYAEGYGSSLVKLYSAGDIKTFVKTLSNYPKDKIDGITGLFVGELFIEGKQAVIQDFEKMKTDKSLTSSEVYVINKILSSSEKLKAENLEALKSTLKEIDEIKKNYRDEKILRVERFNGQYVLIESQKETFANKFDLYNLGTHKKDTLPTGIAYITLHKIVSENELVFLASGRDRESSYINFPYIIRCIRSKDGQFKAVEETAYFKVDESAIFGSKEDEILSSVSVDKNSIRAVFSPEKGKELQFYADYVIVPVAQTKYVPDEKQLIFEFKKSRIGDKFVKNPTVPAENNAYISLLKIEQNGENCRIILDLKNNAKEYTCKLGTTQPDGLGLPCVDIMLR